MRGAIAGLVQTLDKPKPSTNFVFSAFCKLGVDGVLRSANVLQLRERFRRASVGPDGVGCLVAGPRGDREGKRARRSDRTRRRAAAAGDQGPARAAAPEHAPGCGNTRSSRYRRRTEPARDQPCSQLSPLRSSSVVVGRGGSAGPTPGGLEGYGDCVFHDLARPRVAAGGLGFLPFYVPNSVLEEDSPKFAPTWF